ncbi:MAG: hypothetical protein HC913_03110 [Microscillaceae bacterium]|nr:hypothetical protein [Microscillaceae bacterium]
MNPFIKKSLCNRLADEARRKVAKDKNYRKLYEYLNQPTDVWEHKHFIALEALTEVDSHTLKRLFGQKSYEDTENVLSKRSSKDSIAKFLNYTDWESLDNDLIAEASIEINLESQKQTFSKIEKEINLLKNQVSDLQKQLREK